MPRYKPGDKVEIETRDRKYTGILLERPELADDKHMVIKIESGYNIGISLDRIKEIKKIEAGMKRERFRLKRYKRERPFKEGYLHPGNGGNYSIQG